MFNVEPYVLADLSIFTKRFQQSGLNATGHGVLHLKHDFSECAHKHTPTSHNYSTVHHRVRFIAKVQTLTI